MGDMPGGYDFGLSSSFRDSVKKISLTKLHTIFWASIP